MEDGIYLVVKDPSGFNHKGRRLQPGDVLETNTKRAIMLIDRGQAEPLVKTRVIEPTIPIKVDGKRIEAMELVEVPTLRALRLVKNGKAKDKAGESVEPARPIILDPVVVDYGDDNDNDDQDGDE